MKKALITGITGQDGSYLAKHLLDLGYEVFGLMPRRSTKTTWRLEYLGILDKVKLIEGDLADMAACAAAVLESQPDEVYNRRPELRRDELAPARPHGPRHRPRRPQPA